MHSRTLLATALFLAAGAAAASDAPCADAQVLLSGGGRNHEIAVRVADTAVQRAKGLKDIAELPEGTGKLFVYYGVRNASVFVNRTPLLVDMMSFDADGTMLAMTEEPEERGETTLMAGKGMTYAVMLPGGSLRRLDLAGGATFGGWTCTSLE